MTDKTKKGPGRPRVSTERQSVFIAVRLDVTTAAKLDKVRGDRARSQYMRDVLKTHLEKHFQTV